MTTALLVGLGAVGRRAARQLVETEGLERLLVADRDRGAAERVAGALGERAEAIAYTSGEPIPEGVDVVACALAAGVDHPVAEAAIGARVPMVSSDDDHEAIEVLRTLDGRARAAGVTIAAGAGLSPGLADVLARHAAAMFDVVTEIRVARTGWAGPASALTVQRERRSPARERARGSWQTVRPRGDELVWFPDPIGARDCQAVASGVALLSDAFPDVERISVHLAEPAKRRFRRRLGDDGDWGAVRVEVWGRRGETVDVVVYGVIERTAVAAGTALAVTALQLAGVGGEPVVRPGVSGLGELVEPVPFLAELAARGVRAAVFEGVPVS